MTQTLFDDIEMTPAIAVNGGGQERERIARKFAPLLREEPRLGSLVAYGGNRSVPFLRLYRYKEAFSFELVREFQRRFALTPADYVFDPFAGMGTTLFASMLQGMDSIGVDRLPIACFVAQTLPKFLSCQCGQLRAAFERLVRIVPEIEPAPAAMDVAIMPLAFLEETRLELCRWKAAIETLDGDLRDVFRLLFFAILEATSFTSKDGQFLRLKRDKVTADPTDVLQQKVAEAEADLARAPRLFPFWEQAKNHLPTVCVGDTRDLTGTPFRRPPTAIITSPPYVNRYDYTRSYCLELCFHFIRNFDDLKAIRFGVLRSHIESKVGSDEQPPHPVIAEVVDALKPKDLNNPRIPLMLIGYFVDMQKVIAEWARVLARGAQVAMVVDNVRFEGELVPVDLVLSEMAESVGFRVKEIIVTRYKGNSSQQMKKYGRVPVRESIVVWQLEG
ncbi:MAG: site-specific DNA-methyltransferase [Abditibacteriales bacterium]|nr:site-specific DNA-methyltransferase [Abditibacteriales bacterium]MDW8365553.1 hypothetical protein [Abditibacteriales bacterium]